MSVALCPCSLDHFGLPRLVNPKSALNTSSAPIMRSANRAVELLRILPREVLPLSLRLVTFNLGDVIDPCKGRATPVLSPRNKFANLTQRTGAKAEKPRPAPGRRRVDCSAACRAKCQIPFVATLGSLHKSRKGARQKVKGSRQGRHDNPKSGTGNLLAILTVAQLNRVRIDFCLEPHIAAETGAVDFHR